MVLGVAVGGALTVAGVNGAGVLVGGWDSVLILVSCNAIDWSKPFAFGIPRMATNNTTVTSTGTGQVM